MNKSNKLVIAAAVSAALFGSSVAQAHVTYNYSGADKDMADWPVEDGGGPVWAWTDGDPGYSGNLPASWVAFVHNHAGAANTQTASNANGEVFIGVGARAYKDGNTNWGHNADFGLFHLEHDADVTITMSSDNADLRPAFGLWSGWATGGSRHSEFANNGALLTMAANPLNSGLGLVDVNAWAFASSQGPTASASLMRHLTAGDYTLILGGYDGTTPGQHLGYSVTISAAPVPLPSMAWLFASAITGLSLASRSKARLIKPSL